MYAYKYDTCYENGGHFGVLNLRGMVINAHIFPSWLVI